MVFRMPAGMTRHALRGITLRHASFCQKGYMNQSIIMQTQETKSRLPSLYRREEFPSLKKRG